MIEDTERCNDHIRWVLGLISTYTVNDRFMGKTDQSANTVVSAKIVATVYLSLKLSQIRKADTI